MIPNQKAMINHRFKIGDLVETIDDDIRGKVIDIRNNLVTIEDDVGFSFQFNNTELMKLPGSQSLLSDVEFNEIEEVKLIKNSNERRTLIKKTAKSKKEYVLEIDLHIHNLTDSTRGLSNFDMLNLQLDTARQRLENAIRNKMPKIVFIHGVGEGVLKMELHTLFRRYEEVTFYDADFRTYGYGATEVKIFQNI